MNSVKNLEKRFQEINESILSESFYKKIQKNIKESISLSNEINNIPLLKDEQYNKVRHCIENDSVANISTKEFKKLCASLNYHNEFYKVNLIESKYFYEILAEIKKRQKSFKNRAWLRLIHLYLNFNRTEYHKQFIALQQVLKQGLFDYEKNNTQNIHPKIARFLQQDSFFLQENNIEYLINSRKDLLSDYSEIIQYYDLSENAWCIADIWRAKTQVFSENIDYDFKDKLTKYIANLPDCHKMTMLKDLSIRYTKCQSTNRHESLEHYFITEFGHPQIAESIHKWPDENSRKMILEWLVAHDLMVFFSLLSTNNTAINKDRLYFWEKYTKSISALYIVFSDNIKKFDLNSVQDFIKNKQNEKQFFNFKSYSSCVFLIEINGHGFLEYNDNGNECRYYNEDQFKKIKNLLKKSGNDINNEWFIMLETEKLTRKTNWEDKFKAILQNFNIYENNTNIS